ncbi:MAG: DUF2442 domain-containing protein [Dehalococcoidia bacterium]|nr:DUF2442 domain-containing protein [Dehalococcoidia bacterium]
MEREINGVLFTYPDKPMEDQRIVTVTPLPNFKLFLTYDDGAEIFYDVSPLFEHPQLSKTFLPLKNQSGLFRKVTVGTSGFGIVWNDKIDIGCDVIYADGQRVITKVNTTGKASAIKQKSIAVIQKKTPASV